MKFFRYYILVFATLFVVGLSVLEFKNQADLKPEIVLIKSKDWTLVKSQEKQFLRIQETYANEASLFTFVFNFKKVFSALHDLSFIEQANWSWNFAEPLKIKAYMAQPKALFFKNQNWFLIDKDGEILKKLSAAQTLDLPIFRSEKILKDSKLLAKSFKILNEFEKQKTLKNLAVVSEVDLDSRGVFVLLSLGYKIYIDENQTTLQLQRLLEVLNYIEQNKILTEFIDTRLVKKILVRPKKKS